MAGVTLQPVDGLKLQVAVVSATATGIPAPAATVASIIRVYKLFLVSTGASSIYFADGTTALCGAMALAANGAITLDLDGQPWFTCSVGANFNIQQSTTNQISGAIYYTVTPWSN